VSEVGFRISDWDSPLRPSSHRTPGRYHRAGSPPTQYIALHPLAPWAEYLRYHDLRKPEDVAERRLAVWAIRVDLANAVEIGFENSFEDFNIKRGDLVGDDYTECQELADRLRADASEPKEIVVPSAALPGARNLVIFGARESIPYQWTPVDTGDLPACVITRASKPPDGLLERVRFSGEGHAELQAWEQGWRYELTDLE
jgi:RES domain-containing protein